MPQTNDFHSEEVQEIMGKAPSQIIRWGITILFILLLFLVWSCYIIQYPQIVSAPITITPIPPPITLTVQCDGVLDTIYVHNKSSMQTGDPIAALLTPTDYQDLQNIEALLIATNAPEDLADADWTQQSYSLGDLQYAWMQFATVCQNFKHYLSTDPLHTEQTLLQTKLEIEQRYYSQLNIQSRQLHSNLDSACDILTQDSILCLQSHLPQREYDATKQLIFSIQSDTYELDAKLTSTQLSILATKQQLADLARQRNKEIAQYKQDIEQMRQQLLSDIHYWKAQHVITTPINGTVIFQRPWSKDQQVTAGTPFANIISTTDNEIIGLMRVNTTDIGKILTGQTVNIKLHSFPYTEYGILKGQVRSISAMPQQTITEQGIRSAYIVEIIFPAGMTTTYGKQLPAMPQMEGTGEIITQNIRLLDRLTQPIRFLFRNR